jgi:nitrogen-specific signal transduction histidine kinase
MPTASTMGQLTASIAHEIKQPIAAVRTNAAAALRFLDKSPADVEVREALACIVNDTDRTSDVVDRIECLIKKATPRKEVVDLNAAILEVTALTRGEAVKSGVTVGTQLAGEAPRIRCDRVQLQQVMLNLIVNAIHSMSRVEDGNRELHISTARRRACASRCGIPALGCAQRACRVSLNLLHDEARRHGHGPLDLPLDCRSSRWAAVGDQVRAAGCSLSVYDPR